MLSGMYLAPLKLSPTNEVSMSHAPKVDRPRTRLFLARHGQTRFNKQDIVRGNLPGALDATGRRQAHDLAGMLKEQTPTRIVAGPLSRAQQTAACIAQAARMGFETESALLDRDYGPWTGCSRARVEALFGHPDKAPDIEPYALFAGRVRMALSRIMEESAPGDTVVVVAHKAVNRALLGGLFPYYLCRSGRLSQRTGCWNLCEFDGHGWSLRVIDALPHSPPITNHAIKHEARQFAHPCP